MAEVIPLPVEPDPEEKLSEPERQHMKRASGSKIKKNKAAIHFVSTNSVDITESNVVKVFGKLYPAACHDETIVSDYLPVRDLRVIIRNFKLISPSDANPRKGVLISMLQKYMLEDKMMTKYQQWQTEKEKAAALKMKAKSERESSAEELKPSQTSTRKTHRRTIKPEYSAPKAPSRPQTQNIAARQGAVAKSNNIFIEISPATIRECTRAIELIQKMSRYICTFSERISEMERAVSILGERVSEAEARFSVDK